MSDTNPPPLILIPAAGFGVRVGSPPAKELLLRQGTEEPLIELPLREAERRGWPVLVITRAEKTSLIDYLKQNHPKVRMLLLENPTREWQESLLRARTQWHETNLVLLPDTEWSPLEILDPLAQALTLAKVDGVVARHRVTDFHSWGHIWSSRERVIQVAEKPLSPIEVPVSAWGIFGFRRAFGDALLTSQWESQRTQKVQSLVGRLKSFDLAHFRDLTRPNTVISGKELQND